MQLRRVRVSAVTKLKTLQLSAYTACWSDAETCVRLLFRLPLTCGRSKALVASVSAPTPGTPEYAALAQEAQKHSASSTDPGPHVDVWVLDMAYR